MKTATLNSDEMLKTMVAEAVKQQTQIRSAVCDITLKALQARELGLGQINSVVSNVTKGLGSTWPLRACVGSGGEQTTDGRRPARSGPACQLRRETRPERTQFSAYATNRHSEAGVRVSMLRPRLR
jgi:hypothetical protein